MDRYNNIGIPNFGNGFTNDNPFDLMNKIAPRRFYAPGSSPLDEAKRKVRRAVYKQDELQRLKEFIEDQKLANDEIRIRKRKQQLEADKEARKEEEELKKKEEERKKKFKKEEDEDFLNWVDELAQYNDGYLGKKARDYKKIFTKNGKLQAADGLNTLRHIWNINNMVGNLIGTSYDTHLTGISGQLDYNKLKQLAAGAHELMLEYQRNVDAINNLKLLLMDSMSQPLFSKDPDRYNQAKQLILEYNNQLNILNLKMLDPQLKQLDEEYKLDFIRNNGGTAEMYYKGAWNTIKQLFEPTQAKRNLLRSDLRNELLSEYDLFLEGAKLKNAIDKDKYQYKTEKTKELLLKDRLGSLEKAMIDKSNTYDFDKHATENYINDVEGQNEELRKEYNAYANKLDKSRDYWNVAKSYKKGEQAAQDASLFSKDYWMYVAPGMVGSSNSSPALIRANALQYGSLAVGAAVSMIPGVGALPGAMITNAGTIGSIPDQITGGLEENYSEIDQRKIDALKNAINKIAFFDPNSGITNAYLDLRNQSIRYWRNRGMSWKLIKERYDSKNETDMNHVLTDYIMGFTKTNNKAIKSAELDAGKGLKALFMADNVRTMGEMPVQIAMSIMPTKWIKESGDIAKGVKAATSNTTKKILAKGANKLSEKLGTDSKTGKVISNLFKPKSATKAAENGAKYTNGFRASVKSFKDAVKEAYKVGSDIGETLGYGYFGKRVVGAKAAAAGGALHLGGLILNKVTGGDAAITARMMVENAMNKYQKIYDKLLPKDWMRIAARYGFNIARRGFMQASSEGAEEGVQYLNSKEDFASKYGYSDASLADLIINDYVLGDRIKAAYLSLFGIGNTPLDDDLEFWLNVKGGFALGGMGGFNPGQLVNVYGNVSNAIKQYRTNLLIANSAVLNREADKKDRAANFAFAKLAMQDREAEVANRLQEMHDNDKRRENPEYSLEDYDEKGRDAAGVMALTKNKNVRGQLEAKGIKYGTDEYAAAIADLYNLQNQQLQNERERKSVERQLDQAYKTKEFDDKLNEVVAQIRKEYGVEDEISRIRLQAGEKAVNDAIKEAKEKGKDLNGADNVLELQKIRKEAEDAAEQKAIDNIKTNVTVKSQMVSQLKALLKFKALLNSAKDFFDLLSNKLNLKTFRPDSKTIMDNTVKLIDDIKKELKRLFPEMNLGKTDADLLKALDEAEYSIATDEDIEQLHLNQSVLYADAAVTQSYLNQFSYGIVKNKDGKFEYNTKLYEKELDKMKRMTLALKLEDKEKAKADAKKIGEEDVTQPYDEKEVENNVYKQRVSKILEAHNQNEKLDWMAADAYEGDLITKYTEEVEKEAEEKERKEREEAEKAKKAEEKKAETEKPVIDSRFDNPENKEESSRSKWKRNERSRRAKFAKNRELYEARKAKAEAIVKKIKKSIKKSTKGKAFSSIIPLSPEILGKLASAAASLMGNAAIGAYKINEFILDLKEIIKDADLNIDIDNHISDIKKLYLKNKAALLMHNIDDKNFSSNEDIINYTVEDPVEDFNPPVQPTSPLQDRLIASDNNIIKEASSHYHTFVLTEHGVVICNNNESITYMNDDQKKFSNYIKSVLEKHNTSEEDFKNTLSLLVQNYYPQRNINIDEFVKYRNIDGIYDAISDYLATINISLSIIDGAKVRSGVIGALFDDDYLLSSVRLLSGYALFVEDIKRIGDKLKASGYTIIKVNDILYDENTKNSILADIICVNNKGQVIIIDVLSSLADIKSRWFSSPGGNAKYIIGEREIDILKLTLDILKSKYNITVTAAYTLPVTINNGEIKVQHTGPIRVFDKNKTYETVKKLTAAEITARQLIIDINDLIDLYNLIIRINKLPLDLRNYEQLVSFDTLTEYESYTHELVLTHDKLLDQLNLAKEMAELKHSDPLKFTQLYGDVTKIQSPELEKLTNDLNNVCSELDALLNELPPLEVKTVSDKDLVNKLYDCIFRAQQALERVLHEDTESQIDVTEEEEVIASALEKLSNYDNLKTESLKFVQNWWLDEFVQGPVIGNRSTIGSAENLIKQSAAYINAINSWIDTLKNHVLYDISEDEKLQDWYDTLLSVYFSKLIDNAEKQVNENKNLTKLLFDNCTATINKGRDLIREFKDQFSMDPDKQYPNPPSDKAEEINRISQAYDYLYNRVTLHSPSFEAMAINNIYYHLSTRWNFEQDVEVVFDINKKDKTYIDSRGYKYQMKAGDVVMIVRHRDDKTGKYTFAELPLTMSNDYINNKKLTEEQRETLRKINNVNKKFEKIVKASLQYVQQHKDKKLSYTIGTDIGKIIYESNEEKYSEEGKKRNNITDFLFGDEHNKHDLYTITLSKENGLGISAYYLDKKTGVITYRIMTGKDLNDSLYVINGKFDKDGTEINNGAVIYLYNMHSDPTNPSKTRLIAVPIEGNTIGTNDAKILVNLIILYKEGNRYTPDGYNIKLLLKQRLYLLDPEKRYSEYNNLDNVIDLKEDSSRTIEIQNVIYDIYNERSLQKLIDRISIMTNNVDKNAVNENLLTSDNQVLSTVKNIFKNDRSKLEVTLPNNLTFSRDDFEHQNADGTYGSTYLGYLIRNKLLYTKASGKGFTLIWVDNFKIVDKLSTANQTVEQEAKQVVQSQKDKEKNKQALSDKLDALLMYLSRDLPKEENAAKKTEIEAFFDKVFGDNVTAELDLNVALDVVSNKYILGYCTSEAIKLTENVPISVAYHEAFHRVFELLIDDKLRDKFYEKYRERFGLNLSDRDVAESFADIFTAYMENKDYLNKNFSWLKRTYNKIAYFCGVSLKLGLLNTWKLYNVYWNINKGKYKNVQVSEEKRNRFKTLFKDNLYYTVTNEKGLNVEYTNLSNSADVNDAVKAIGYFAIKKLKLDSLNPSGIKIKNSKQLADLFGPELIKVLCGEGVANSEKTDLLILFTELFLKETKLVYDKNNIPVRKKVKVYPKLDGLINKVLDYIDNIVGKFTEELDEGDEYLSDEETKAMNKNIDKYGKLAFESSKLEHLPNNVKYFFATIPYLTNVDGHIANDLSKNKFGVPTFMTMNEVFNILSSDINTCKSLQEFDKWLFENKNKREMYGYIYEKFHTLYKLAYTTDEKGNLKVANYNAEAYCILIVSAVRSLKLKFVISQSKKQEGNAGKETTIKESSMDRDKYTLTKTWCNIVVSGQIGIFSRNRVNGNLLFVKGVYHGNNNSIFTDVADLLKNIQNVAIKNEDTITIDGNKYNLYDSYDLNQVKDTFVHALNKIGIDITKDALNYMLLSKYEGNDLDLFMHLFTDNNILSKIDTFILNLNNIVINLQIIEDNIKTLYTKTGFVSELATYFSKYRRLTIESQALGLNGKKLYNTSLNNTVSHIITMLNTKDKNNSYVKTLLGCSYNLLQNGPYSEGSIIAELINANKDFYIDSFTYIGSKTDNKNDNGSEYKEEVSADDYMAKLAMLLQGMLIFPTLADKGTWMCLTGIKIPGMTFTRDAKGLLVVKDQPTIVWKNGRPFIRPNNTVLDRIITYAKTERLSICECMEDLGYDEIPGYKKQGRRVLKKNELVKNYHTKNKVLVKEGGKYVEKEVDPNGTRFLTLTEIAVLDKDGAPKLDENGDIVTINLNNPNKSSAEMLSLANKYFFDLREGETVEQMIQRQRDSIAYTLNVQYQSEIESAINLGIIERQDITQNEKVIFDSKLKSLLNLTSTNLNIELINMLAQLIFDSNKKWKTADHIKDGKERFAYQKTAMTLCKSLAIAMILSDATTRSIISINEITRCFTGNPAYYKVKYHGDYIFDSAFDLQKRLGGIVSTGEDNIDDLIGAKQTYRCAECKDYEVASTAKVASTLEKSFVHGMLQDTYCNMKLQLYEAQYNEYVELLNTNKKLDTEKGENLIKDALEELNHNINDAWANYGKVDINKLLDDKDSDLTEQERKVLERARNKGKAFADSYKGGINVADGEAYITADMCKDLLRRRGALTEDAKAAFDLLESEDKYSWQDKADAYDLIYNKVNLVTTKYTAFGFRSHNINGETVSNLAIPYYNKYSLAPIFPCMATGNMKKLYDKMLNEKVDVLLMDSAVKVGSQGAVKYNGESIDEPFNVYEQDFGFLRRQLNTDPEEETESTLGTQMLKLVLQNLRLHRDNYRNFRTGSTITGENILHDLMLSINKLTEFGADKVKKDFGIDEHGNIDQKKLSQYLISQLSSRDADKGLLKALSLDKDGNITCPLAATSSSKWIESILISQINKSVIDILTPGTSFVQRSVFAMESSKTEGGKIQSDKDLSPKINGGLRLEMINEVGAMDCVVSIDYFKGILPEGLSFNEAKKWLFDHGIIGHTGSGVKPNTIGYRIPTLSEASIHSLRIVDVIPAVQSTIILPEEFTKVTGSDFDIDHLYLASYNYQTLDDGTLSTQFPVDDSRYFQNQILDCMQTLLLDTENSMHCLFKSIDNDTELLTNIAELLPEGSNIKHRAYNFGTLHEQIERREDYITGKFGIGPFALNVTNQTLCRIFGVRFKETPFTKAVGLVHLDLLTDMDGNAIDSWISAFINAHVDIVKDPYISKMNVNKFTYNLVNLLIRTGFGESAMWFIAQPIMVELAKSNNKLNSQLLKKVGISSNDIKEQEFLRISSELGMHCEYLLSELTNSGKISAVNFIKEHSDVLKYIVINRELILKNDGKFTVNGEDYTLGDVQDTIYNAYKILEPYSSALGELVQKTKIDTKKQGKSLLELWNYYTTYNNLFNQLLSESLFDMNTLHNLLNNSWIRSKTYYGCKMAPQILLGLSFYADDKFLSIIYDIYNKLNYSANYVDLKTLGKLGNQAITLIKSKYFTYYVDKVLKGNDKDYSEHIRNLFTGNKTMASRLNNLIYCTKFRDKYKRLANNYLLNSLYIDEMQDDVVITTGVTLQVPLFIKINDNVDSNLMQDAWLDLMTDEDLSVRNFAKDLVVYAFMTSGEDVGWNSLYKYVPIDWVIGDVDNNILSFADFVKNTLTLKDYDINVDEIIGNNYRDYNLVHIILSNHCLYYGKYIIYTEEKNNYDEYVKLQRSFGKNTQQYQYSVYKLKCYTQISDPKTNKVKTYPVYEEIHKAGYDSGHKQRVYQYGWYFMYKENSISKDKGEFNKIPGLLVDKHGENFQRELYNNTTFKNTDVSPSNTMYSILDMEMHSGGAYGADTLFDVYARRHGITNIHHYRDANNTKLSNTLVNNGISASILTEDQMNIARTEVRNTLGINLGNTLLDNLKARNYYQVVNSDGVFAIAYINDDKKSVKGGTNFAVLLGILLNKQVHVFDINTEQWYTYDSNQEQFIEENTPILTKSFAGVGSRDILNYKKPKRENGIPKGWEDNPNYVGAEKAAVCIKAISDLFNKTEAYINSKKQNSTKTTEKSTLNVYAGTNENTIFSNFAERQVTLKRLTFKTVEGAFQYAKLYVGYKKGDITESDFKFNTVDLQNASGKNARNIGRGLKLSEETLKYWNEISYNLLKKIMIESFVLNPAIKDQLIRTGDAIITHKNKDGVEQDNGRFSLILTDIRREFQSLLPPNSVCISQLRFSRNEAKDNPNCLYIFTDNINRDSGRGIINPNSKYAKKYGKDKHYPSMTQAVLRGLDNAMPISTQHWYNKLNKGITGRWHDSDIEEFKKVIDEEIQAIMDEWDTGNYTQLVIGTGDGFFNSDISNITLYRTPELYNYLKSKIQLLYDYIDNSPIAQEQRNRFGTEEELKIVLNSDKTILSNSEILAISPFTGNDKAPRIAVASEHTDPAFFAKQIVDWSNGGRIFTDYNGNPIMFDDIDALYLITKHDGLPMLHLLQIDKPKIIHFSVTTLGDTKYEPGVMKWQDMIEKIGDYIKQGLDPEYVTLRIDPIVPGVTKIKDVEALIKRASELGLKHVRFSVMDYYPSTAKYMKELGYDYSKYYDKSTKPGYEYNTNARDEVITKIANKVLEFCKKYNMDLSTCAEACKIDGVSKEGCLGVNAVNRMLGTSVLDRQQENNKFRLECTCYGGKTDLLSYNSNCASRCIYCYAHHNSDKTIEYYNSDGTLKDINLTKTRDKNKTDDSVINMSEKDKKEAEKVKNYCKGGK